MLWTLVIGLLVGIVAKFLMPGPAPGGIILTVLLGIGGAMVANWAGDSFGIYHQGEPAGFVAAVVGSMFILFIYKMLFNSKKLT